MNRIQVFQGNVIRMHRGTVAATVTVRASLTWRGRGAYLPPAPSSAIELVTEGSVRRSRLYYYPRSWRKAACIAQEAPQ